MDPGRLGRVYAAGPDSRTIILSLAGRRDGVIGAALYVPGLGRMLLDERAVITLMSGLGATYYASVQQHRPT